MDDLYELGARAILTTGHPRLPPLTRRTARSTPMPTQPELPALPVTFRPTRTRVVLLTVGRRDLRRHHRGRAAAGEAQPGGAAQLRLHRRCCFLGVLVLLRRPKVVADEAGVTVVNLDHARGAWTGRRSCGSTCGPATRGCSSTSATAPACPRSASSRASPRQQAIGDARALRALAEARAIGDADGQHGPATPPTNVTADRRPSTLPHRPLS